MVKLLLSKGSSIPKRGRRFFDQTEYCELFLKWPFTMAVIVFRGLSLYSTLDASSLIDLNQYIGCDISNDDDDDYGVDDYDDEDDDYDVDGDNNDIFE